MDPVTIERIKQAPKVLLHDHLDGGMRPATVIDLANETGYDALPTTDPDDLAAWFRRGADRNKLELYLETFAHTVGEFGVVLMVGGNIPDRTRVASIEIYENVETLNYADAHALSLILLVISFITLFCVFLFNKRFPAHVRL